MYKYEFKLKQVTPMIHFQHDEPGATLRSTEVKPKLDKFLWYCIKNDLGIVSNLVSALQREYVKDKTSKEKILLKEGSKELTSSLIEAKLEDQVAFRYQLRIKAKEVNVLKNINAMYFGNIGKNTVKKYSVSTSRDIVCTIVSDSRQLLDFIKEILSAFFLLHNFGTRQSKGFGSFIVKNRKLDGLASEENIIMNFSNFDFVKLEKVSNGKQSLPNISSDNKMELARWLYALMKGGVNGDRSKLSDEEKKQLPYFKGFISYFFLKKDIGNEKSKVKKEILKFDDDGSFDEEKDKKFVRALLGLAENYIFAHDELGKKLDNKVIVKVSHNVHRNQTTIQRYKSPLLIKITNDNLFIIPKDDGGDIMNKTFKFSSKKGNFFIKVPSKKEAGITEGYSFAECFLYEFVDFFKKIKNKKIEYISNMSLREIKHVDYQALGELSKFELIYLSRI